jgi:Fur family ferric uptake transcriptional regulator
MPTSTTWSDHTIAALKDSGHRAGGARAAVIELLGRQDCCLSAQEIFDTLRTAGRRVGIASVYRVLEQLSAMQLVQRVEIGDGVTRYEPVHPDGEHHHHLICDQCGRVLAFEDAPLEKTLAGLSSRIGHQVETHDVVLRGSCADCSTGN